MEKKILAGKSGSQGSYIASVRENRECTDSLVKIMSLNLLSNSRLLSIPHECAELLDSNGPLPLKCHFGHMITLHSVREIREGGNPSTPSGKSGSKHVFTTAPSGHTLFLRPSGSISCCEL